MAVAAVGQNALIGAPADSSAGAGAGAAFLFNATSGSLIAALVQPDGAGGGFGTSVAGTGTTALIGAPGANVGQSDAGAAYLFDADPTSPTFGAAIAAVGSPTPVAAGFFGQSVSFSDQAIAVGAAARPGSGIPGSEAAYIYQPGVPLSVLSQVTFANASNNSVILSGTFTDPGLLPITATVDWGDGSPLSPVILPFGSYAFALPHRYASASAGKFSIAVTLVDHFGGSSVASVGVAIADPAPSFAAPGLVLSSSSINEGGAVTASGTIISPGGIHTNTVVLDWGDGSPMTTLVLPPGVVTFATPHRYANNPAAASSGQYKIDASVTNEIYKIGRASTSVTVSNVAPLFTSADLSLSEPVASENDTITLNGQFSDPGALDPHEVIIDWGDGSAPTLLLDLFGQIVSAAAPGVFDYSAAHQYRNNPAGTPTGGTYTIHVSVSDDVSTTSVDQLIVVNNVPPTVRIESSGGVGAGTISLTGAVIDPGALDTHTLAWTLTQNGVVILTGAGPSFTFATPSPVGVLVATAIATDSDGATGVDRRRSF